MADEGKRIFACVSIDHGTTAPIPDGSHASFTPTLGPGKTDQGGAGAPGVAEVQTGRKSLTVQVFGADQNALLALLGAAAANLVLHIVGVAGALQKCTIKNVIFTAWQGPVNMPRDDEGGNLQMYGISGVAEWGAADTWAEMIVWAADV